MSTTGPTDDSMAAISKLFTDSLQSGDFDDLTIREVKARTVEHTEKMLANDPAQSVVGIVVLIVVT